MHLYLPKEEEGRDLCWEYDLPRRLCEYLGINNQAAIPIVGSVFRMDKPPAISKLLEKAGVRQVDFDFSSLEDEFTKDDQKMKALVTRTRDTHLSTPSVEEDLVPSIETVSVDRLVAPRLEHHGDSSLAETWSQMELRENRSISRATPTTRPYSYEAAISFSNSGGRLPGTQETSYQKVLENVVDVARNRAVNDVFEAGHPRFDSSSASIIVEALSDHLVREVFATRSYDRNFKLGAAGELYV